MADLSDPLLIDIVRFYSDLPVLLQIIEAMNGQAQELHKDVGSAQQASRMARVLSAVIVLNDQFISYERRARTLIERIGKVHPQPKEANSP